MTRGTDKKISIWRDFFRHKNFGLYLINVFGIAQEDSDAVREKSAEAPALVESFADYFSASTVPAGGASSISGTTDLAGLDAKGSGVFLAIPLAQSRNTSISYLTL